MAIIHWVQLLHGELASFLTAISCNCSGSRCDTMAFCTARGLGPHVDDEAVLSSSREAAPVALSATFFGSAIPAFSSGILTSSMPTVVPDTVA